MFLWTHLYCEILTIIWSQSRKVLLMLEKSQSMLVVAVAPPMIFWRNHPLNPQRSQFRFPFFDYIYYFQKKYETSKGQFALAEEEELASVAK